MKLYNKRDKNKLKLIFFLKNLLPLYKNKLNFNLFLLYTLFFIKLLLFMAINNNNNNNVAQFYTSIELKNKDLRNFLVLTIMFYLIVSKKLTRKYKRYNKLLLYVRYKILHKYYKYHKKNSLYDSISYTCYINHNLIFYSADQEIDFWFDKNIVQSPYFLIRNNIEFKYKQSNRNKIEYLQQDYVHNLAIIRIAPKKIEKLNFELGDNRGNNVYKARLTYFDAETAFNYLESGGLSQDSFIEKNIELSKKIFPLNRANLLNERQYGVVVPLIF